MRIRVHRIRAAAFTMVHFEKDTSPVAAGRHTSRSDEAGNEVVSTVRDENEKTTATRSGTDFLKKLDKDRNEKRRIRCAGSMRNRRRAYNAASWTVTTLSERICAPQFFIPIITLLQNAAMNALQYKSELAQMKAQNIDITNFEDQLRLQVHLRAQLAACLRWIHGSDQADR